MTNHQQATPGSSVLKIKKDLAAIEKAFAAISGYLTLSNEQSDDFARKFESARNAGEKFPSAVNDAKFYFNDIGTALRLTGTELEEFAQRQTEAFRNQATQSFTENLREIQTLLGLSNDEMREFAKRFGELGAKFEPKSDLGWWLDDRMQSLAKGSDAKLTNFYDNTLPPTPIPLSAARPFSPLRTA